jgi:hypothetical protein
MFLDNVVEVNAKEELMNNSTSPSFSLPGYIINLFLPKCTMVHGEVIPSTYFQIALNINHRKEAKKWQKNRCWLGLKTISKTTNFNVRTIDKAIKVLIDLGLLEKIMHGRLKMYQLKNDVIQDVDDLVRLNLIIENKLLGGLPKEKFAIIKEKFDMLNKKINFSSPFYLQQLLKKLWIPDINTLRDFVVKAEKTYKGSSLFFMNILSHQGPFKIFGQKDENVVLSEKDRSLMIGCSQSTLNRYILAYESANIITRQNQKGLYDLQLAFNKENSINNNLNEGVVDKVTTNDLMCPICKKEFNVARAFGLHVSKATDAPHALLYEYKKQYRSDSKELFSVYEKHKDEIDALIPMETIQVPEVKMREDKYMEIACTCKQSCHECFNMWRNDYFNDCTHARKAAYIEEYEIDVKPQVPVKKKTQGETSFDKIPSTKTKGPAEDTAPGLLKYFYNKNGKTSPNFPKESRLIKNLLTRKENPLTADQIREVLDYMSRRGHADLRFITTSVGDAIQEKQNLIDADTVGTAAYLVKKFYEGQGMQLNLQTLSRDVQRVQETINLGSYEETDFTIEYMIEIKCNILNFIGSKRQEAMAKKSKLGVKVSSSTNNNFMSNPSFFDQSELAFLKDELTGGRINLRKVEQRNLEEATKIAVQIFKEHKFTSRYTAFEWAWRIGLPMDSEIYNLAMKEVNKQTYMDFVLSSGRLEADKVKQLEVVKSRYESWLEKQHQTFGNFSSFTQNF